MGHCKGWSAYRCICDHLHPRCSRTCKYNGRSHAHWRSLGSSHALYCIHLCLKTNIRLLFTLHVQHKSVQFLPSQVCISPPILYPLGQVQWYVPGSFTQVSLHPPLFVLHSLISWTAQIKWDYWRDRMQRQTLVKPWHVCLSVPSSYPLGQEQW